jgi:hypothetical protein
MGKIDLDFEKNVLIYYIRKGINETLEMVTIWNEEDQMHGINKHQGEGFSSFKNKFKKV